MTNFSIQIATAHGWEVFSYFYANDYSEGIPFADSVWYCPAVDCDNVVIIDEQTGEILWDKLDELYKNIDIEESEWIDDDCGFDPYLGCYDFDC